MRTIIDSDRGIVYTVLCYAIAYGLIIGAGIIPMLYAFGYIAGLLFLFLTGYLWLELSVIIAAIVYYFGVFIAATVGMFVYEPIVQLVDTGLRYITDSITSFSLPTITLPAISLPTISIVW